MGFYDRHILPRLLNLSCGTEAVQCQRRKVVPLAEGRVLEIGIGTVVMTYTLCTIADALTALDGMNLWACHSFLLVVLH